MKSASLNLQNFSKIKQSIVGIILWKIALKTTRVTDLENCLNHKS